MQEHRARLPRARGCARGALAVILWVATGCASLPGAAPRAPEPGPHLETPELHYLIGRDLEAQGRVDEAIGSYERALALDPASIYLLKHLAELSARRNDLVSAVRYAEGALAADPDDMGVRLFLGGVYRFQKDPDAALRVLRDDAGQPIGRDAAVLLYGILNEERRWDEARDVAEWMVAEEPEGLRGTLALADAYEKLGNDAAAEATLRQGLARRPAELAFYGALARSRRDRGDREGELAIYEEVLIEHPDHHATLLARAEAQLALGRTEQAITSFERVQSLYPDDLRSLLRLGFLEFELDRLESAAARFELALSKQAGQHEVTYFLGVVRRRLDQVDQARAIFETIPEGHERYSDARTQVAAILENEQQFELAIVELDLARAAQPSRTLDLYRGSLLAKGGDVDGALEFLDSLQTQTDDDAEVLYNMGIIYGEARDVEEAIRTMEAVLALDPDHAGALNYLGYTYAERGRNLDEAEAMISRALELRPDDGYITDSLGWVYYMRARPHLDRGEYELAQPLLDRAASELQRAATLTGGDPVISEHLGDVYLGLQDKEAALRSYEEAVSLTPRPGEQPNLFEKLERLRRELGR